MSADISAVTRANEELYAAFEAGDADRMAAVWDDGDDVVCVHPGWPLLRGRAHVLRSWSVIMANTAYIQFFLTDVAASVQGDVAVVSCEESILVRQDDAEQGELGDTARVVATNVFRRTPSGWRLWAHHGSPVLGVESPT